MLLFHKEHLQQMPRDKNKNNCRLEDAESEEKKLTHKKKRPWANMHTKKYASTAKTKPSGKVN